MPDTRRHRGSPPGDGGLFSAANTAVIRKAVEGYADKSSLKLICDRFGLTKRQRLAVMRSGCADEQLERRNAGRLGQSELADERVIIDGYNVLITIEGALSGAFLFVGRDCCVRDIAGLHGTYRKVSETIPAVQLVGSVLERLKVKSALWLVDRPVSNSGKLKKLLIDIADENDWRWDVRLAESPDKLLVEADDIIATSDSAVLDRAGRWFNLAYYIIRTEIKTAKLIDLSDTKK